MKIKSAVTLACFWGAVHATGYQIDHEAYENTLWEPVERIERHVAALFVYSQRYCGPQDEGSWWQVLTCPKPPCPRIDEAALVCLNGVPFRFEHLATKFCLRRIQRLRKIEPFFETWDTFRSCQQVFPDAEQFLREFCILTFLLYKNLSDHLTSGAPRPMTKSFLADAIIWYQRLDGLPILEILTLLDDFLDELSSFSEGESIQEGSPWRWQRMIALGIKVVPIVIVVAWSWLRSSRKAKPKVAVGVA